MEILMIEIEKILLLDKYRDCVCQELLDEIEEVIIKYRDEGYI